MLKLLILTICIVQVFSAKTCVSYDECVSDVDSIMAEYLKNYMVLAENIDELNNRIELEFHQAVDDLNSLIKSNCYKCHKHELKEMPLYYMHQSLIRCNARAENEFRPENETLLIEFEKFDDLEQVKLENKEAEFCNLYTEVMNFYCEKTYFASKIREHCKYMHDFRKMFMRPWVMCMREVAEEEQGIEELPLMD